jgi:phenylpropionate dioxygenase-like ring-hydroxylating dioxygenase large terminal subunit
MNNDATFNEIDWDASPGAPLSPWTYSNPELFELEYEALFLRRWQLVGHVNDVPQVGDFVTHDIGRDNIFVVRGKDEQLRAFKNVCRHRASRVLEGSGTCKGVIRCPYHGWTYQLDGSLMAIPRDENFEGVDKESHGLHEVELEQYRGLLFVRLKGDGPSVAEHFGDTGRYFDMYGVADYVQCLQTTTQIWDCNWKVAWDNYLENYHIAIGHPGLSRLVKISDVGTTLTSGVSYGEFDLRSKPSNVAAEREYQEMVEHAQARIPEEIRNKWVQFGFAPNLGIDLYPELLDIFQLIPLAHDKTMIRASYYGHRDPTPEEEELRRLNILVNAPINDEDKLLCARVQQGLQTHGYTPGPLSYMEMDIYHFHEMIREQIPVAALKKSPLRGQVAAKNFELLAGRQ